MYVKLGFFVFKQTWGKLAPIYDIYCLFRSGKVPALDLTRLIQPRIPGLPAESLNTLNSASLANKTQGIIMHIFVYYQS